jgi:hypothetical protein
MNRQTITINIPTLTMNEQTDKGNQYTYDGHRMYIDCPCLSVNPSHVYWLPLSFYSSFVGICIALILQWMNRQTITINIPTLTMNEQTDKGNQYTYDGKTNRQGQSIYLRWMNRQTRASNKPTTHKGNQYTYDGGRQARAINIPTLE